MTRGRAEECNAVRAFGLSCDRAFRSGAPCRGTSSGDVSVTTEGGNATTVASGGAWAGEPSDDGACATAGAGAGAEAGGGVATTGG
jgi:hypothetical protein